VGSSKGQDGKGKLLKLDRRERIGHQSRKIPKLVGPKFYLNSAAAPLYFTQIPGTDVMILKIFSPKKSAEKLAFFAQTAATFGKNLIITLVFEKNANFLPKIGKNRSKL
jgi:hypothetical protein